MLFAVILNMIRRGDINGSNLHMSFDFFKMFDLHPMNSSDDPEIHLANGLDEKPYQPVALQSQGKVQISSHLSL